MTANNIKIEANWNCIDMVMSVFVNGAFLGTIDIWDEKDAIDYVEANYTSIIKNGKIDIETN